MDCSKESYRRRNLAIRYGISYEIYDAMLAEQDGRCKLCHRKPGKKRLCVDHDHRTGRVRGLLCKDCNYRVLGQLCDETKLGTAGIIAFAERLIAYVGE